MTRQLLPISALLLGSALLLFAGGLHGLLLPVRGGAEGFSALSLGLLGTGWAIGYVAGCVTMASVVARVGHIRAFCVMAALAAVSILGALLIVEAWAWIALRALSGFCFAGAAMIVESWLSERSEPQTRGRIFGVYTMVNLVASTAGQLVLPFGDPLGYAFFVVAAIGYCLALVPTALSNTATPAPLVSVRLDLGALWRNSPVAVVAVFLVGISNGSFGTLAPVYAERAGLELTAIAIFAAMPVLAGAAAQIPVGAASDKVDRRLVLIGLSLVALVADAAFLVLAPEGRAANLALAALLGAAIFSMYPVILAHANDHAAPGTFIQVSGGLLMVFGLGSIVGPLVAGVAMTGRAPSLLFAITATAHVGIVLFALWRMRRRAEVPQEEKADFIASPPARIATPETAVLAATEAEAEATLAPEADDTAPEAVSDPTNPPAGMG
ncbi:MAG: MFS transporter [Paracoccaceae bacterium]|jgi:MFS family permease|nr:MFS transporter [Paracoccaceae bacterium]